jgi:hypothetical protein
MLLRPVVLPFMPVRAVSVQSRRAGAGELNAKAHPSGRGLSVAKGRRYTA